MLKINKVIKIQRKKNQRIIALNVNVVKRKSNLKINKIC